MPLRARDRPRSGGAVSELRARGVQYAILHERFYGAEPYRRATQALDGRDDVVAYGPFADGPFSVRAYRLASRDAPGTDLDAGSAAR